MSIFSRLCTLIFILFLQPLFAEAQSAKDWTQQAQAATEGVDIYTAANFDSEVLTTIKPGKYYWISAKPDGPFYKILLGPNKIGYVPDTELDIKGKGTFQPRDFLEDEDNSLNPSAKAKKNKAKKSKNVDDEDDESQDAGLQKHLLSLNLVNYHEDTLGGVQVGDLFAVSYKNFGHGIGSEEAEYGLGGFSWDVMAAFDAPEYYRRKTGFKPSGYVLWGGFQFQNYSYLSSFNQLRYGIGPFLKYSSFDAQTTLKKYSLQDITIGLTLEASIQFVFRSYGIDVGLRYYWDKTPYGVIAFGVLF